VAGVTGGALFEVYTTVVTFVDSDYAATRNLAWRDRETNVCGLQLEAALACTFDDLPAPFLLFLVVTLVPMV